MAGKKVQEDPIIANMKAISDMYRDVLSIVDVKEIQLLDGLDGEQRRDFCKWAHATFHSPYFNLIIKNFVFAQAMLVSEKGWDHIAYNNGQMTINGIHLMRELIYRHANIWETEYAAEKQDFDPHRSFEPGNVRK
jgi:hypothetical protein